MVVVGAGGSASQVTQPTPTAPESSPATIRSTTAPTARADNSALQKNDRWLQVNSSDQLIAEWIYGVDRWESAASIGTLYQGSS